MRSLIIAVVTLLVCNTVNAQRTFTHGPGNGIEAQYFDTSLAPFYHGVASGDPLDDRVIIWTRVTPQNDTLIPVEWKMATDTGFHNIVAKGNLTTDYTKDYTVKVDVAGLQPGVTYYYYFTALNKNSLIGRTNTLPLSTVEHLRFAVVSCVNYQMGYFNGYKRIAERQDIDAVLHLGDYMYEYPTYGYGYTAEVDRKHQPDNEIITLDDYRIRHSFYKLDQDLRAAHQQHPFITVWDDHEVANNTYETGAANHDSTTEGDFETRKQNAIRAYLEWMPIRHPAYVHDAKIYRKFSYGSLVDLLMMDTRVEDRDKQAASANDPLLQDTSRRLIGDEQRNWLLTNLNQSNATWKILGNQIMFSQNGPVATDAWTGYPAEREMVMKGMEQLPSKNNIILTGDTHRSWAFDLTEKPYDTSFYKPYTGIGTFGVEFGAPSVASPNRNESSPGTSPAGPQTAMLAANPQLRYTDMDNHGYFVLDITRYKAQADFFFVDTKMRSSNETFGQGWYTIANKGYLLQATSPAVGKTDAAILAPEGPAPFAIPQTTGIQHIAQFLLTGIYPNPAHDYVYVGIILNKHSNINISIIDVTGKMIFQHNNDMQAGNNAVKLPLDNVSPGVYVVIVKDDTQTIQKRKIVIQ